jgi:hypothetical protein
MRPLLEVPPQASGQITAHHHLDGEGLRGPGDGDVGVRGIEHVVGDHVLRLLEPELGDAVQHLALERNGGEHPVEGAEPVGGDEEQPVALPVHVAHLAPVPLPEGVELSLGQGVTELLREDRVRHRRMPQRASAGAAAR